MTASAPAPTSATDPPPLLVTRDGPLADEVTRLAAAADVRPNVAVDPVVALAAWDRAPLVLVGADVVADVGAVRAARRPGVHVIGWSPVPTEVFRHALAVGAESVVELPRAGEWLVELLVDVGERSARGLMVGVVGGAGGAGATTLACALGQVAGWRAPTLVVDTDALGPGIDRVLGLEAHEGVRWEVLGQSSGRLGSRALRDAVPRRDGVGVLAWSAGARPDVGAPAVREVLSAAQRGHELVVVDLARQDTRLLPELVARCDHVLVVTPATVVGAAATVRTVSRLRDQTPLHLVLRPGAVPAEDVAAATSLAVLSVVPHQRGLQESVDLGLGPVRSRRSPLVRAARELLDGLAA